MPLSFALLPSRHNVKQRPTRSIGFASPEIFHSTPHATLFSPPSHLMIHIKYPGMKLPLAIPPLKTYTDKKTGGAIHPCPANKHWTHSPS